MKSKKLVTIATPNIAPLCAGFLANQQEYAERHGYDYHVESRIHWKDLHPSFSKVWEIGKALEEGYEFVIWADADVLFTNHKVDLVRSLLAPELWLAGYQQNNWQAWKYICAGLLVIRNCSQARDFVDQWEERCELGTFTIHPGRRTRVLHHPWEQWYFDELIRETSYEGIYAAKASEIGCFAPEIWSDGIAWEVGMPTVHFAGPATWEQRQAILPAYLNVVIK